MDHCGVTSVHRRQLGQVCGSWQGAELNMSGGKDQVNGKWGSIRWQWIWTAS